MKKAAIYILSISAWVAFVLSMNWPHDINMLVGPTVPAIVSAAYEIGLLDLRVWR